MASQLATYDNLKQVLWGDWELSGYSKTKRSHASDRIMNYGTHRAQCECARLPPPKPQPPLVHVLLSPPLNHVLPSGVGSGANVL